MAHLEREISAELAFSKKIIREKIPFNDTGKSLCVYPYIVNLCSGSSPGLVVTRFALSELRVQVPEKSMVVTGRASDLNSPLSSNKVPMFTREQTARPLTGHIESINKSLYIPP